MKPASMEAYNLLHQGTLTFAELEKNGIRIDTDYLRRARERMQERMKKRTEELQESEFFKVWKEAHKEKTKLGSGAQLANVLFNILEYPNPNPEGKLKSDEKTLDSIKHPFVRKWSDLEKMRKAEGTFLAGIEREVVDGFIHPFFNLNTVRTYRSSSDHPNFHNFPVRNPKMAKLIRRCFIPRDGHVLVEIDYGGIEVRVSACYNKDPNLISYIQDPSKDMHRDMAAECFMCDVEDVSKEMRYCAKNMFVFPQFYGSFYIDCAKSLWAAMEHMDLEVGGIPARGWLEDKGITSVGALNEKEKPRKNTFEKHISEVEKDFWERRFDHYARWKRKWYKRYLNLGGYHTLTGFVIEGMYSRNDVINHPIQGTAFHCLLWSLIRLLKVIKKRKMKTKLVGQIHDSIVADVPVNELDDYLALAKRVMTEDLPKAWEWIIVPLEIEAEVCPEGGSWFDKKEVKI